MKHSRRLVAWLVLLAAPLLGEEPDRVLVVRDHLQLRSQLRISSVDDQVAVGDIVRGVARLNGYDDGELKGGIPAGNIPLHHGPFEWALRAFNWVMQPCVRCEVVQGTDQLAPALEVTVERQAARDWINHCKAGLRNAWSHLDCRRDAPAYGLVCSRDPASSDGDVVVLVHGLNSRPEDLAAFVPLIEHANMIPAHFRYPNDQPIDASARLLAEELRKLRRDLPHRQIRLLTHSMGGLVARGAIELRQLDPGNVSQLIMVAPPNQGSGLASVALFMDCYEFVTSAEYRRAGVLVDSVTDGLGEATADLQPNSVFLDMLNARPRNPRVRYTILLGTKAPMRPEEMRALRNTVRDYSAGNRYLRFASSKLRRSLDGLDEVVEGQGDGVVAVWRGRLRGVTDVVQLPFSHGSILDGSHPTSQRAYAAIAARLSL